MDSFSQKNESMGNVKILKYSHKALLMGKKGKLLKLSVF
jgi:hypothetical protein